MGGFPKTRSPATPRLLDTWIRDLAKTEGLIAPRLRLRVGYMVVAAALARMRDVHEAPLFILKGGVAMQLRFGWRARSSADIDMVFRDDLGLLEETLQQAPRHPVGDFAIRAVGKAHPLGPTGAVRQQLRVEYKRKAWAKIYLEVSPAEGGSVDLDHLELLAAAPDVAVLGLPPVEPIPCMPIPYQVAQKLHACTEVSDSGEENTRFHDLLDLQLLAELIDDRGAARSACEETFGLRRKHSWPPSIKIPASWPSDYASLAETEHFPVTDVYEATRNVEAMIERIRTA